MNWIRPLREQDDRKSFDCDDHDLNGFLHDLDYAADIESGVWKVWVMVPELDSTKILSYYVVSPEPCDVIREGPRSIGHPFTAIDFRLLATDYRYKRRGYGKNMILHAMRNIVKAADRCIAEGEEQAEETYFGDFPVESAEVYRIDALYGEAIDEEARDWYLRQNLGFRMLVPGGLGLVVTIDEMRDIVAVEPAQQYQLAP